MQECLLPVVSLGITICHRIETQIETRVFNMTTRHIKADPTSYSIKSLYDGSSYFYAEERFLKKSCRTIELEYEQERIVQCSCRENRAD